jgi:hypothetical protein
MRDRNIVWLINALACEPNMNAKNSKHRKFLQRSLARLNSASPIVKAFRTQYADWFVDETPSESHEDALTKGFDTHEEGIAKGIEGVSKPETEAETKQYKGEAVDLEHPTAGGADDGPATGSSDATAGTASPAAQRDRQLPRVGAGAPGEPLPKHAQRLLRECYDVRAHSTLTNRQQQVVRDLRATLGGKGALLERAVYVRAFDSAHLDDACKTVLDRGLKKNDAALRLVLLDLRKTYLERSAAADKAARNDTPPSGKRGDAPRAIASLLTTHRNPEELAEAKRWLAAQPKETHDEVERQVSAKCPPGRAPSWREHIADDATLAAWRSRSTDITGDSTSDAQEDADEAPPATLARAHA